jgi:UDP-GlcNAc:undecaprenyl-phosphate/decaprenyl-phosphate GlcNAc-1-phosphate transferase
MASWSLAIIGALAAFLLWNLHPASIFMGDCGALPLGMLLGVLSLHAGGLSSASHVAHYAVPVLLMLVPLLDTIIVSVSRMATGIPVSRRGLDHSHHRLLGLGLTDPRVVLVCWIVAGFAGICAVILAAMPHAYVVSVLPIIAVIFALIGCFMIDLTFDARAPGIAFGYLQGLSRLILSLSYKRRVTEIALDFFIISAAFFGATLIRADFQTDDARVARMLQDVPLALISTYLAFALTGVYRGIWRYAGMSDVIRIANGAILSGAAILIIGSLLQLPVTPSVVAIFVLVLFNLTLASRLSFRVLRKGLILLGEARQRILIVGAGEIAESAARYVTSGRFDYTRLVGYIDDDYFKLGKMVHGYKVLGTLQQLDKICDRVRFDQILIADESLAGDQMALIWAFASQRKMVVRRFSIRLNEMGAQTEAESTISGISPAPQFGKPGATGQVVA